MSIYLNIAQVAGNFSSESIVNLTKGINDSVGKMPVDKFMDSVSGIGHRVKHGHDLSYLPEIFDKFGMEGVRDFFVHNFKDFMSPHGVPIPFADNIRNGLGLSYSQSINWLSINIGKFVSGGLSVAHSGYVVHSLLSASAVGVFSSELLINTSIGGALKLTSLIWAPNPITLFSGLTDLGVLAFVLAPYLLNDGTIPLLIEQSTSELIFAGTLKGILISLAIGVPIELGKHYFRFKKGEEISNLVPEFMSSIVGLTICGAAAGCVGSVAFIMSSVPLISIAAGVASYGASSYIYNKKIKKKLSTKIKDLFFKEKLYIFEDGTIINRKEFKKLNQLHEKLDFLPSFPGIKHADAASC